MWQCRWDCIASPPCMSASMCDLVLVHEDKKIRKTAPKEDSDTYWDDTVESKQLWNKKVITFWAVSVDSPIGEAIVSMDGLHWRPHPSPPTQEPLRLKQDTLTPIQTSSPIIHSVKHLAEADFTGVPDKTMFVCYITYLRAEYFWVSDITLDSWNF